MLKDKSTLIPLSIIGVCILIAAGVGIWKIIPHSHPSYLTTGYHTHADFKVYLNGKAVDFTQAKYQSTEDKHLDEFTHLHDGNGDVMHFHKPNITLGYFFKTLGIEFTKDCFILDTQERLCATPSSTLQLFVNGEKNNLLNDYIPHDLDRLLITYNTTSTTEIDQQLKSVTNNACIYSEKCPERGKPPHESCAVGQSCK